MKQEFEEGFGYWYFDLWSTSVFWGHKCV